MSYFHISNLFFMPPRPRGAGFSLVELAVVLFIVTLLFGVFVSAGSGFLLGKSIEADRKKLQTIETAIAAYVSVNGRLPCPADGGLSVTSPLVGVEVRDVNGDCTSGNAAIADQRTGVVPWTTLAITEADTSDSHQRRVMYRVAYGLARNSAMDFTACDPAGTATADVTGTSTLALCTSACLATCRTTCVSNSMSLCTPPFAVLPSGRGIQVRNDLAPGGAILMDNSASPTQGAAYVLISHGQNGVGAYNSNSGALTVGAGGSRETQNANNQVMAGWYAIDTDFNEANDTSRFDDLVHRSSIMKVIMQAQRGPRAH